jgi:hypothetical protein
VKPPLDLRVVKTEKLDERCDMLVGTKRAVGAVAALLSVAGVAAAQTPERATIAAQSPPPPASVTPVDVALWRKAYVDETGVVPVGASDKGMEYGVAGSFSLTAQGTVKGWMRWEEFQPTTVGHDTTRSFTQLVEVDCRGGRGRMLAMDLYPYNNLKGEVRHVDAQDPAWAYPRPGSVLEQNVGMMCSAAKSAVSAVIAQAAAPQDPGASTSDLASLSVAK